MKKFINYIKECIAEMKKVAWPTGKQVVSYTKVILITTVIFAVILGLADFLLLRGAFLIF